MELNELGGPREALERAAPGARRHEQVIRCIDFPPVRVGDQFNVISFKIGIERQI